jgi:hypothetical protein
MEEQEQEESMAQPQSVAYQQFQALIAKQNEAIKAMSAEIKQLKNQNSVVNFQAQLQEICGDRPETYQQNLSMLEKFSTDADRKVFLDGLKIQRAEWPVHPATHFAQHFQVQEKNEALKEFAGKPAQVRQFASRVYQDYLDTINHPYERVSRQFANNWPTAQKFINFCLEMEEIDPGYYDQKMMAK